MPLLGGGQPQLPTNQQRAARVDEARVIGGIMEG